VKILRARASALPRPRPLVANGKERQNPAHPCTLYGRKGKLQGAKPAAAI
jgi:hypothetical protein